MHEQRCVSVCSLTHTAVNRTETPRHIHCYLSPEVKWPSGEADYSHPVRCWKRGRYTSTPPTRLHDVHSDAFSQFQLNPRTTLHDVMPYSVHATLPVRLQVRFMPASAKCRLASKPYEPRTVQFTVTRTVLPVQQSAYSSDMHTAEHCCNTRRPSPSNYRRRRNAGGRNAQGRNVWPRNSLHCMQHNAAVDCVSEQTRYCKRHRLTVWCNSHQRRTQFATHAHKETKQKSETARGAAHLKRTNRIAILNAKMPLLRRSLEIRHINKIKKIQSNTQ